MLKSLIIQNLAIVTRLELDFHSGMTAFTGETGAGKSIMIDALMLAMGGKADSNIIRSGQTFCEVSALFDFELDSEPGKWLEAHDIDNTEQEVWLRRVIYQTGRSKAYINGTPMPLPKVKALSEWLMDIHGQHQHQRLLKPATHRTQLDQYANHPEYLNQVSRLFSQLQVLENRLEQAQQRTQDGAAIDFLKFQIQELESLSLQPNELETLSQEHFHLHHAKTYLEHLSQITHILHHGSEENPDVSSKLHHLMQLLQALPQTDQNLNAAIELIQNAVIQCEEAQHEIEQFAKHIQLDPERLSSIESRMGELHDAARKYHTKPEQLHAHLESLKTELAGIESIDEAQAQLKTEIQQTKTAYLECAQQLSQSRQHHAQLLEQEITNALQSLGIQQGIIQVKVTPYEILHGHGLDQIEYHVSTNPGIPPHALTKVASGGELSRISLAIQVITAKRAQTPTLFFDEVDVGIGGETAARVGQLLRTLGQRLQVFCVTHQAQVAAAAHHHYLVKKTTQDQQTFSSVQDLNHSEKTEEIARMLGGHQMHQETWKHAQALIHEYD